MKLKFSRKMSWRWTIMDTYLLRKFIGSVFYAIALLMTIIIVFDISQNMQYFSNTTAKEVITGYYLNFIPYFVTLFFPLFTFISVIWFTSKLSERNEIISFFNGGVSFYRFIVPYIVGAILLGIFCLFLSNFVVPDSNARLNEFKDQYFHGKKGVVSTPITQRNFHFKNTKDSYVYVQNWRKAALAGDKFTYEIFGKENVSYKLSADRITYDTCRMRWHLYNYQVRTFDAEGNENLLTGRQLDTTFNFEPADFSPDVSTASTMNYRDLKKFIRKEQEKGSSLVKSYQIEQHRRVANPASIVVMTLLGLCVAARKTQRGIGVHLFIGMFFVFTFIFMQQVSTVFAVSESLSPAMAIWLPNLIYLGISGFLLFTIPK